MAVIPSRLQVIYSIYQDTRFKIQFSNGMSNEFPFSRGVKKGDVLNTMLFTLFIDDLVKNIELSNCAQVMIEHIQLNTILYANDISLLSSSQQGSQRYLNV